MRLTVSHDLDRLQRDLKKIPGKLAGGAERAAARRAQEGNRNAKRRATRTAGKHGKHYPSAFIAERVGDMHWRYGPITSIAQGAMSFEGGSRNQPPHLDLEKSAAVVGPKFGRDISQLIGRVFW